MRPGVAKRLAMQIAASLGDPVGFIFRTAELESGDVAGLILLTALRLHLFRQAARILRNEVSCDLDDADARPKVLLETDLGDVGISALESGNVLDGGSAPLVDRLIVVADHAEICAQPVEERDDPLLHRVDVLVFVDDYIVDAIGQVSA